MTKPIVGLVYKRNNNIPFVFEAAERLGIDLIEIYAAGENPQPDQSSLARRLEFDVFGDPEAALDQIATWAESNRMGRIMTSREDAIYWPVSRHIRRQNDFSKYS